MNIKCLSFASLAFVVYADVSLIFAGPDYRKISFMNISLIHIIELELWLYAAYCDLSVYSINEDFSKIVSFSD